MIVTGIIVFMVSISKIVVDHKMDIQVEHHNNLVRFTNVLLKHVKILRENQKDVMANLSHVMAKVSQLTKSHKGTKDKLIVVEYFVNYLHEDLKTLKDSVNHIEAEEERLLSDDKLELDSDNDINYNHT